MERLPKLVDEEREGDWVAERHFDVEGLRMDIDEEGSAPRCRRTTPCRSAMSASSERFRESNVIQQKQDGFRGRRGQGHPWRPQPRPAPRDRQTWRAATPAAGYARPCTRTSSSAGSATKSVYELWKALGEIGLDDDVLRPDHGRRLVPRTDSCKLGITSSMGLNGAVQARVEEMDITDELTKKIHIKMSGCPNGCREHHIANIGFYGASIKVGEHTIPAYVAHIGGNYDGGEIIYGTRLKIRLPAKRIPDAVERWIWDVRARPPRGRGSSTPSQMRVEAQDLRGRGTRPGDARRVRHRDDERVHRR